MLIDQTESFWKPQMQADKEFLEASDAGFQRLSLCFLRALTAMNDLQKIKEKENPRRCRIASGSTAQHSRSFRHIAGRGSFCQGFFLKKTHNERSPKVVMDHVPAHTTLHDTLPLSRDALKLG